MSNEKIFKQLIKLFPIMFETKFEDGSEITQYLATAYTEGFEEAPTQKDIIRAWSYLIGTGAAYQLQGWFGRTALDMINRGYFEDDGAVNWEEVELILSI